MYSPAIRAIGRFLSAAVILGMASACTHTSPRPWNEVDTVPDENPERVHNIVFTTIPPDYLADRAEAIAANGIDGFMVNGIMHNWDSDIWQQPTRFAPDAPKGRVVGAENVLLQKSIRMNEAARAAGIEYNSIKVAFYSHLPDWFDDDAWTQLVENFRQAAIFARMGGYAGVSIDIEYISEMYDLDFEDYQAPDYPRDRLRAQARKRGYEIMAAMVGEYPDMINWHLPTGIEHYGPLATDLFIGMIDALAEADAPGGMHVSSEATYLMTGPSAIIRYMGGIERRIRDSIRVISGEQTLDYWERRGTVNPGLWPLGYYREITDDEGNFLGYSGKEETFGNKIVGSYSDKSENYSAETFRDQYATARTTSERFVWIYGHGPVLWQMTPEEMVKYHAGAMDTVPTVANLSEYLAPMRDALTIGPGLWHDEALRARDGQPPTAFTGFPPRWWHAGPMPMPKESFGRSRGPEQGVNLDSPVSVDGVTYPWRAMDTKEDGSVDLMQSLRGGDNVLAYSVAWVETDRPRNVYLGFGRNDYGAVYINGTLMLDRQTPQTIELDQDVVEVELPAGRSEVLVKTGNIGGSGWGFILRFADADGTGANGIRWVANP